MENRQNNKGRIMAVPSCLFEMLEERILLSKEFVKILENEKKILIKMEINPVVAIARSKERQLGRITKLDQTIAGVVNKVLGIQEAEGPGRVGAVGQPAQPVKTIVRLSELVASVDGENKSRLVRYKAEVEELHDQIQVENIINQGFAREVLEYIDGAISTITNAAVTDSPSYGQKLNRNKKRNSGYVRSALISREV
jgi:hypothetical protein